MLNYLVEHCRSPFTIINPSYTTRSGVPNLTRWSTIQSLGQRSNCCKSRKCIWGHIPMHEIFSIYIYFFIPVLSRPSFTFRTPDEDQKDRATLLLSSRSNPITWGRPWAPWWTFLCMLSASAQKSTLHKKWHILVPLDWFNHHPVALVLLYNMRLEWSFSI